MSLKLAQAELVSWRRYLAALEVSCKQVLKGGSDSTRAISILFIATQLDQATDQAFEGY